MIRMFLYVLLAYIAWKIIRIVSMQKKNARRDTEQTNTPQPPPIQFPNIEEAKFEDLPPPPSSEDTPSPKK